MANYDNKLGEWFKQVEKRAEELLARKRGVDVPQDAESTAETPRQVVSTRLGGISESRPSEEAQRADSSAMAAAEAREVVAEVAVAEKPEPTAGTAERQDTRPALFDDAEISPVEDFFSFLSRSADHAGEPQHAQSTVLDAPEHRGALSLAEGTGIPRPIAPAQEEVVGAPAIAAQPELAVKPEPAHAKAQPEAAQESTAEQKWERVPQHLRILFDREVGEVAQHSYKTFKESRASLIEQLLDPSVTLEDAARILNVCPTTVRRYTNRGVLTHYRTAGNQRRFKLSDVLAFMESRQ